MKSHTFIIGLVALSLWQQEHLILATEPEATESAMSSEMDNGLSALEIKIEAEQIQEENNELLQRIINLADDVIKETADMVGEVSPAGEEIQIDAEQHDAYCQDHSSSIKEIAYKLWKDGKNITKTIEDIAEMILDYESAMEMDGESGTTEAASDSTDEGKRRRRRSAADDATPAADDASTTVAPGDDVSTTVGEAASTPVVPINTTVSEMPISTVEPVDVKAEASEIVKLAEHSSSEFDREIENIITLANEMKVVTAFQADNIYENDAATDETKEDIRDTEEEVVAFSDRIIDTALNIRKQNSRSMDMITTFAESIQTSI